MSCLNPKPKSYANSLLSAVEFLARPVLRPPAMAMEIDSGGMLERRFKLILSHEPKRSNSRWLRACVLLCAMVVLPLGMASAQDYGAVGKRLKKSVRKGEITQQHADAMMAAIKKEAPKSKSDTKLESAWKKLQAMVKKGKLTEEQAHAKMSAIKTEAAEKEIKKRMAAGGRRQRGGEHGRITREEFARAEVELRKAVAEGRISGEDARARIQAMRKAMRETMVDQGEGGSKHITREDYTRTVAELRKAVVAGKISREDARKMIEGAKRRMEMSQTMSDRAKRRTAMTQKMSERGNERSDLDAIRRRIEGAVEAGKMTREQAGERIAAYKKRVRRGGDAEDPDKELDYVAIGEKLKAAVKAGKLTKEEAMAKWEAIKREAIKREANARNRAENHGNDYEAIGKKIKAAVAAGKITEREARAKWKAIKKKAGSKEKESARYRAVGRKLEAAVKAGKLTEEEAKAKWVEIKEKDAAQDKEHD